jgi:hypothetical protein
MKKTCPQCQSKNVIPILYGMPSFEAWKKELKGLIRLGGCELFGDDPQWYCKDCKKEF